MRREHLSGLISGSHISDAGNFRRDKFWKKYPWNHTFSTMPKTHKSENPQSLPRYVGICRNLYHVLWHHKLAKTGGLHACFNFNMRHLSIHDMTVNYTFVSALLPAVLTPQGSAIAPCYVRQNNIAPRRLLCHANLHAPLFLYPHDYLFHGSFFLSSFAAALEHSLSCFVIIYGAYHAMTIVTSCMLLDVNRWGPDPTVALWVRFCVK